MGQSDEDGVDGVSCRREGRIGSVIGDRVGVGHVDQECDAQVVPNDPGSRCVCPYVQMSKCPNTRVPSVRLSACPGIEWPECLNARVP